MKREFTMPTQKPQQAIINGHTLSLSKDRTEIAEFVDGYWSDPIWRGSEYEGPDAFRAIRAAVEGGMDPQDLQAVRYPEGFRVFSMDQVFDMIHAGELDGELVFA